jgi:hypothetical protein
MKLRYVTQLEEVLDRELSWRKKELTTLKFTIDGGAPSTLPVLLRAGTALLYAHWEGFVKECGTAYVQHVAMQKPMLAMMSTNFVAVALGDRFSACGRTEKTRVRVELVEKLRAPGSERAKLKWRRVVRTRANLKAQVLKEVLVTLGLRYAPFEPKAKTVIDRLVSARNCIAHGKGLRVEVDDYTRLHTETIILLDEFKSQVLEAAVGQTYLASPTTPPAVAPPAAS